MLYQTSASRSTQTDFIVELVQVFAHTWEINHSVDSMFREYPNLSFRN